MKELMQGTVILSDNGHKASKLGTGVGWLVECKDGRKPWETVWALAKTKTMTNRKVVKSKAQAKRLLEQLDKGEA